MKKMIAIVGDAQIEADSRQYRIAYQMGRLLIVNGYRMLSGGLAGVMEAASRGARSAPNHGDGDIVALLPGFDPATANGSVDIAIATGLGLARNVLIANAEAVIAIGGGAGTLSEMAYAWQFKRLILAWRGTGWSGRLADQKMDHRQRCSGDWDDRVFGFDQPEEAIDLLAQHSPHYPRT